MWITWRSIEHQTRCGKPHVDRRDKGETQIPNSLTSRRNFFNRCPAALTAARACFRQRVFQHADRRRQPGGVSDSPASFYHLLLFHPERDLVQPDTVGTPLPAVRVWLAGVAPAD